MKRPYLGALTAGAIFGLLSMTPAVRASGGQSRRLAHSDVVYATVPGAARIHGQGREPAKPTASCDLVHDFNTSQSHFGYIALCPMFH